GEETSTNRVAFLGGWQNSFMQMWAASFEDGAKSANPDVEVLIAWIHEDGTDAWFDPDGAAIAATSLFLRDVDVIFTAAGGSGAGTAEAARSFSDSNDSRVWAIGVDADEGYLAAQAGTAPFVLTSMIKKFDYGVEESIARWVDDDLAKHTTFDLENGGIDYSRENPRFDPTPIEAAEQQIISGAVVPKTLTDTPSTYRTQSHITVPVTSAERSCEVGADIIADFALVDFVLTNAGTGTADFIIAAVDDEATRDNLQSIADETGNGFAALEQSGYTGINVSWTVAEASKYSVRWLSSALEAQAVVVVCNAVESPVFSDVIQVSSLTGTDDV
ncbi:MAG: BMP family lipoprotein, partial [Acidimicrobiia bacterium]